MIYLSHGLPKSASTFCYQLGNEMLRQTGHVREEICEIYLPVEYHVAFMNFEKDEILQMSDFIPDDKILIVKTHTRLNDSIDRLLKDGKLKATATFRDPRDAAISLLDSGEKDRRLNKNRPFSEIFTLDHAFDYLKKYEEIIIPWLNHPDVLKLSYNLIAQNPIEAARRIRSHLNIDADVTRVIDIYFGISRKRIWEFNVGKIGRYKEYMSEEQQEKFHIEFGNLIALMNTIDDRYMI